MNRFLSFALALSLAACTIQTSTPPAPAKQAPDGTGAAGTSSPASGSPSKNTTSTSVTTSTSTTDEGAADQSLPTAIDVKAPLDPGSKAIHDTEDGQTLVSLVSVSGASPSLSPAPPNGAYPNLADPNATVTILSPDPGDCQPQIMFTYNASSVAASISGADDMTKSAACAKWMDDVAASGLEATVANVGWSDVPSGSTDRVTVHVTIE